MFKIFLLARFFSPSPHLQFGLGLRSISLFYAELQIFQKRHTFTLLFRAKMNRKAGAGGGYFDEKGAELKLRLISEGSTAFKSVLQSLIISPKVPCVAISVHLHAAFNDFL